MALKCNMYSCMWQKNCSFKKKKRKNTILKYCIRMSRSFLAKLISNNLSVIYITPFSERKKLDWSKIKTSHGHVETDLNTNIRGNPRQNLTQVGEKMPSQ